MFNQAIDPSTSIIQNLAEKLAEISLTQQDELIQCALKCLEQRIKYSTDTLSSPVQVHAYLRLQLGDEKNEVFAVLFLDSQHRVLAFEKLFYGTINTATIHPRVIIQRVLAHNAAAAILVHNHPSGALSPSGADQYITQQINGLLKSLDVELLDHIIVSLEGSFSFVEHKLL